MLILGISEEHDAGISVLLNGEIIFAVNEERYTRVKFQDGWPKNSLKEAINFLQENNLYHKLEHVAIASKTHVKNKDNINSNSIIYLVMRLLGRYLSNLTIGNKKIVPLLKSFLVIIQMPRKIRIKQKLKNCIPHKNLKITYIDHHDCHAYSAVMTSGWQNCFVVTLDAAGDGASSKSYIYDNHKLKQVGMVPFFHSVGYYYGLITIYLGFKPGREGKVTGLSAHGNYDKTLPIFEKLINYDKKKKTIKNYGQHYLDNMNILKRELKGISPKDIAAGIQTHLENILTAYISDLIQDNIKEKNIRLALAGGVFANVLLNSKIAELPQVSDIFIHPNMGDGGLATGAALAVLKKLSIDAKSVRMNHVYLGHVYKDDDIIHEFEKHKVKYKIPDNIEKEIAKLLSKGKVIARFEGAMEYGPRALGHRSILYSAKDNSVNTWLNKRLKRTEYMPFAPAVLEEIADKYFILKNKAFACEFMTIVCEATELAKKKCPAVVHIDGTARPQIVKKNISPSYWKILNEYKKITGVGVLVNTSFNMHEEPIIENPMQAVKAFKQAKLDALAIGNIIITK
ncbi:MAG: hypothetical protein OEZ13_12705 [Spirochaetia bacterium]|nr:hypothetical protein [Spirochaetia bacterium]